MTIGQSDAPTLRRVAVTLFEGIELLDVSGATQVLDTVTRATAHKAGYEIVMVASRPGPVRTGTGVSLVADRSWHDLEPGDWMLLVPGGLASGLEPLVDPELVEWLQGPVARRATRVVSICTGAHILAAAGLLDGRHATTHWATAARLAADHPTVKVDPDAIFVHDDDHGVDLWTSAGVSAGIDLALAIVAADLGPNLARLAAQLCVVHLQRHGGQNQFSAFLGPPHSTSERVAELLAWMPAHLSEDLSVEALATRLNIGTRHLARVFHDEVGCTAGRYVERLRIQAAADLLTHTDSPLGTIAKAAGFGSLASLHRGFVRHHGITPGEYRHRFGAPS